MESENTQAPICSHFGHFTKSMEVIDGVNLNGKTAVVTGGHTGIGLWTTKALVEAGAHVIVLARNTKRAKSNLRGLSNVDIVGFDLLNPQSIDDSSEKIAQKTEKLDILVCSAGIIGIPLTRDERGYEYQLAANYLGHFQLVARLYPLLKKANEARVVLVSSRGHKWGGILFDDPNFEKTEYTPNRAYAQSKSALSLFAVELDKLAKTDNVRAFAVHPGPMPSSDLFADSIIGINPTFMVALMRLGAKLMRGLHMTQLLNVIRRPQEGDAFKTIQQGASTVVWCAVSSSLDGMGGLYCEDCNIAQSVPADSNAPYGVRPWAIDPEQAERVWQLGEELTGIRFDI